MTPVTQPAAPVLDSDSKCQQHRSGHDQKRTVGPARPRIGQPAGSARTPSGARLDGMTSDTAVLPAMSTPVAVAPARPRGWVRQLGVDTGYNLFAFPFALASFVVVVTGLA